MCFHAGQWQRLRRWWRWTRQCCLSQLHCTQEDCSYKECVSVWVYVCICGVSLWLVFFLYRWFCPVVCVPGSVCFLCRGRFGDALGGGKWSNKRLSAMISFFSQSHFGAFLFLFLFVFVFTLLSVTLYSPLTPLSSSHLSAKSSPSLPVSFVSLSLSPCHSFTTSISSAGTPE